VEVIDEVLELEFVDNREVYHGATAAYRFLSSRVWLSYHDAYLVISIS
jgi:hypothetical protein